MKFKETEAVELKRNLNDTFEKEVVAFLNTLDGTIYLGVEDDGSVCGILNIDETMKNIAEVITNSILPNPSEYIKVTTLFIDGKMVIAVEVKKGDGLYYIKKYGRSNKGCYVRIGTSVRSMTEEQIEKCFVKSIKNNAKKIINIEARRQDLKFRILKNNYIAKGFEFNDETFEKNYNLLTKDNKLNLLANLLADVNDVSLKITRFNRTDKTELLENTEYGYVSILQAMDKVLSRLEAINITKSTLDGNILRKDKKLIDPRCLREAFLNSIGHNDWVDGTPPAVYIFSDRIEIISTGGLPEDLTIEEFYDGISKPRSKELMRIFRDLDYVEQSGFGIRKIISIYGRDVFKITDNFIRVILPFDKEVMTTITQTKSDDNRIILTEQEQQIVDYIKQFGFIRRSTVEDILNIQRSRCNQILNKLVERGIIKSEGKSSSIKYKLNG